MTLPVDIVNLALQSFGSRTTVTAAQLAANSTNEAKQANLTYENTRDTLLRMAPWDCAMKTANLAYITSVPGTPENSSAVTNLWQPGQPRPPYAYEYQYPVDCLRACWMLPSTQLGFASGVPITTAVTGGASTLWNGTPIRFKIATDAFYMASVATIVAPGAGYVAGEIITVNLQPTAVAISNGLGGTFAIGQPQGAPVQVKVLTVDGGGGILTTAIVPQIIDSSPALGGSYFYINTTAATQNFSTGAGTGATFTFDLSANPNKIQRVILTNQEFATLCYVQQVVDPNVWDPLFQDAMANKLGADICKALTGDKGIANMCISMANASIVEARKVDGNEGLTINDVTPDWIRTRGIWWSDNLQSGPYSGFDWGGILPSY